LSSSGEQVELDLERARRIALLGEGSAELAVQVAISAVSQGLTTVFLDPEGGATLSLSGYVKGYDGNSLLGDTQKIAQDVGERHAELVASAYSTALRLSSSEELVLSAAVRQISLEGGVASPTALSEVVGTVTGFRSQLKQDVEGKLALLSLLDRSVEDLSVKETVSESCVINFATLPSLELGECALLLFLARLLALGSPPELLVLSSCHRFLKREATNGSSRLKERLLTSAGSKLFATDLPRFADGQVLKSTSVRVLSGSVWNALSSGEHLVEGTLLLQNLELGCKSVFIPHGFELRGGQLSKAVLTTRPSEEVIRLVLSTLSEGAVVTRSSIISFLSPDYQEGSIGQAVDMLLAESAVVHFKESKNSDLTALAITEVGRQMLRTMSRNE